MGEIADELIDQGILDWCLHVNGTCYEDCQYCREVAEGELDEHQVHS